MSQVLPLAARRVVVTVAGVVVAGLLVVTTLRPTSPLLTRPHPAASSHPSLHTPPHPHHHCRSMFTVDKKDGADVIWDSDAPYRRLGEQLAPLLAELQVLGALDNISAPLFLGTRLELMEGDIPYIPCKVREYGPADLGRCSAARAAGGASTWLAFIGDSNQRQKIHSFLSFLPPDLHYTYRLGTREVSRDDFSNALAHHKERPPVFDIVGRRDEDPNRDQGKHSGDGRTQSEAGRQVNNKSNVRTSSTDFRHCHDVFGESQASAEPCLLRVTVVWAPGNLNNSYDTARGRERPAVTRLRRWVARNQLPDVVVIGFGTWLLEDRQLEDELAPFTELEAAAEPLLHTLSHIAHRTNLLYWSQSRYRWFNFEGKGLSSKLKDKGDFWRSYLYLNQFQDAIPLLDSSLWRIIRRTGAWLWDTTLPFNLANLKECQRLSEAGLYLYPLYKDRWWNCFDAHHASYETNSVEIQMLLNLLCNSHLAVPGQYCCSTPPPNPPARLTPFPR